MFTKKFIDLYENSINDYKNILHNIEFISSVRPIEEKTNGKDIVYGLEFDYKNSPITILYESYEARDNKLYELTGFRMEEEIEENDNKKISLKHMIKELFD